MSPPENVNHVTYPPVTTCNGPMALVWRMYLWLKTAHVPDGTIARELGINRVYMHRLHESNPAYFSPVLIRAFLDQQWALRTIVWQWPENIVPAPDDQPPAYIILRYPPRQCPITDQWFVPRQANERFYPGLSEAVKRAARRDITTARRRYAHQGDWGKEEQV